MIGIWTIPALANCDATSPDPELGEEISSEDIPIYIQTFGQYGQASVSSPHGHGHGKGPKKGKK